MAIYHLHVKVIGRKSGQSAVASAAYRSASRLRDERIDRVQDFSNKRGVVHSEVLLPENAPEAWSDRERLWNDVEAFEVRKEAQLAREIEFAIPREMTQAQGIELARDFAQAEFVDQGMIADLNVHCATSMTVRAEERSVAFDLKDYNKLDHSYAATIHKAQGMTVDRTHVLATPGMDAHGSYVALSRHRDGMDLHYGRDDFADQNRLARTLSRDRAKDMATDYDPAQSYAERRGITFRERMERVVEIVKQVPEKVRGMFDGLRLPADAAPGSHASQQPQRAEPERTAAEDPEAALRKARTDALVRHARAVDTILAAGGVDGAPPAHMRELTDARNAFDKVRPHGSHDAEVAYVKNPELVREAAGGRINRVVRALQLETEIRTDPQRRADRFVERWQKLGQTSQRQYQAGDMSGYKATRSAMGDMANSLQRDPQLESLLANRKRDLGIGGDFDSGRSLGRALAFTHGLDLGRGRGIGI